MLYRDIIDRRSRKESREAAALATLRQQLNKQLLTCNYHDTEKETQSAYEEFFQQVPYEREDELEMVVLLHDIRQAADFLRMKRLNPAELLSDWSTVIPGSSLSHAKHVVQAAQPKGKGAPSQGATSEPSTRSTPHPDAAQDTANADGKDAGESSCGSDGRPPKRKKRAQSRRSSTPVTKAHTKGTSRPASGPRKKYVRRSTPKKSVNGTDAQKMDLDDHTAPTHLTPPVYSVQNGGCQNSIPNSQPGAAKPSGRPQYAHRPYPPIASGSSQPEKSTVSRSGVLENTPGLQSPTMRAPRSSQGSNRPSSGKQNSIDQQSAGQGSMSNIRQASSARPRPNVLELAQDMREAQRAAARSTAAVPLTPFSSGPVQSGSPPKGVFVPRGIARVAPMRQPTEPTIDVQSRPQSHDANVLSRGLPTHDGLKQGAEEDSLELPIVHPAGPSISSSNPGPTKWTGTARTPLRKPPPSSDATIALTSPYFAPRSPSPTNAKAAEPTGKKGAKDAPKKAPGKAANGVKAAGNHDPSPSASQGESGSGRQAHVPKKPKQAPRKASVATTASRSSTAGGNRTRTPLTQSVSGSTAASAEGSAAGGSVGTGGSGRSLRNPSERKVSWKRRWETGDAQATPTPEERKRRGMTDEDADV